ncbi:Uncharacterised protein [Rhodococcus wratislaviensis]|uniref:Uncharacterized protein n=1 Tax=Rhodococcus wratislaviensis TaxID=44752 RepID=A0AB38FLJ9_RHOWR|nr:Uncharacterised protein [Rhodococcus wratislaviensis]
MVGGTIDEVVGQVGSGRPHRLDVVDREVQFLERESPHLPHDAGDQVIRRLRQWMSLRPAGQSFGPAFDSEETVGVQSKRAGTEVRDRVAGVPDDEAHARERRIQPVDGGLPRLEIVQVHPPPLDAVHPLHRGGDTPVGFLDTEFVEDDALELTDDVPGPGELRLGVGVDVDRVPAFRHTGKQVPVLLFDLHHVIDAGVVGVRHLGEPEVGALAGVTGDDVVDDDAVVR